jgi:hypothetical protein
MAQRKLYPGDNGAISVRQAASQALCILLPEGHDKAMGKDGASEADRSAVIDAAGLQQLISELIDRGYRVVGPSLSGDGNAIVLAELTSADDLPRG